MAGSDQIVSQFRLVEAGDVGVHDRVSVDINSLVVFREEFRDKETVEDRQGEEVGPEIVALLILDLGKSWSSSWRNSILTLSFS